MMKAKEIINILKKNKLLERRTFTERRSDTLPMGEGGKGERSDARTFRRIGRNQKSEAGENRNFPLTIVNRSADDEC